MASVSLHQVLDSEEYLSSKSLLDKGLNTHKGSKSRKKRGSTKKGEANKNDHEEPQKAPKPTFSQWLFRDPLSKLPFVYFTAGILGTFALAVFHFMDADTAYLICGAYIGLTIFGCKHFYTLIGLKQQVDDFGSLNTKFAAEHGQLSGEVQRLRAANDGLRESHARIQQANAKNRENLSKFHGIQETMQTLNLETVDELKDISDRASSIGSKWQGQVIERERDLLHTVFDRFEDASGKNGMTRKDFDKFALQLPSGYKQRFARLGTFRKIAGDGKVMNFSDFDAALDTFAEMEALDVDIDFTIEKKTHSGRQLHSLVVPSAAVKKVTIIEDDDEEWGDISSMKRWKTRRKVYDNVSREIVVKSKDFLSRKAKDFTSSLLGIMEDEEKQIELHMVQDDEEDDEFDEDAYFSGDGFPSLRSEGGKGGLGRNLSVDEIMSVAQEQSERYGLLEDNRHSSL